MTESTETYLIEFASGGMSFGAVADTLLEIAGADWEPDDDKEGSCQMPLSSLLKLEENPTSRTLVLQTPKGTCGFGVESISHNRIVATALHAVPSPLADWLKHMILLGMTVDVDSGRVLIVLDLQRLARLCADEHARRTGESGQS